MGVAQEDLISKTTDLIDVVSKMETSVTGEIKNLLDAATASIKNVDKNIDVKLSDAAADVVKEIGKINATLTTQIVARQDALNSMIRKIMEKLDIPTSVIDSVVSDRVAPIIENNSAVRIRLRSALARK
jgi:hypothetical protein